MSARTEAPAASTRYADLLRWAHARDPEARRRLATALAPSFENASQAGCLVVAILPLATIVAPLWMGWRGLLVPPALAALAGPAFLLDRWARRRAAWRALGRGELDVRRKVEVRAGVDGDVFQSYWSEDGSDVRAELDHPKSLLDAVGRADEFWAWRMPVPHRDGNRGSIYELMSHFDIGLVRRLPDGTPELVVAGQSYYPYDPWTGRIQR